jgi:hypothetical protein
MLSEMSSVSQQAQGISLEDQLNQLILNDQVDSFNSGDENKTGGTENGQDNQAAEEFEENTHEEFDDENDENATDEVVE